MDLAMRDPNVKTRLFRFVDVLPTLRTPAEVARHLKEYLDAVSERLPRSVRAAVKVGGLASYLLSGGVNAQVTALARRFMLGDDLREIAGTLRALHDRGVGFTVDVLGETVLSEADADVVEAIDFCHYYAAEMRRLGSPELTQPVAGETSVQHWIPRGVGVVIAPWNFPLAILTGMTAATVVTGNTAVVKPSDQTPLVALRLGQLCLEAGFPAGVINLLTGHGAELGSALVAHPEVACIAFTGSKEVGLRIWEAAGRTAPGQQSLKRVICEMGGKNAVIIDSDADLDEAVAGTVASAFGYQGQKCSALSRLIVLAENYESFMDRMVAAVASLRVGPAEEPGKVVGPLINQTARQRVLRLIEAGQQEAHLLWQGTVPRDPDACYVPPTIFDQVGPQCRLFREEIFGPVLAVSKAADFEAALRLANSSEFALTGGVYSRSPAHIQRARTEIRCGNLYVNRPITGAIVGRHPFGGFQMSGGGTKAGGRTYLLEFLIPRVVSENSLRRGFAGAAE